MKKFSKIIAVVVAFALMLTVIPASRGNAAANPKLSYKSRTLFAGGSAVRKSAKEEFVLKIKNKPKKYACEWSVSDPSVAFIEAKKYGKCSVKAISVGTAVVKCDLTDKKSGKKYSLETKITVKKNAKAVKLTYTGTLEALSPGATFKLNAELTDEAGNELISIRPDDVTKTSSDYVTDVIKWSSSNSSVATVNSEGLVTAVAPGQTVINCYAVQNATGSYSKIKKATAIKTLTITVKEEISAIKQTALNKLEVVFGKDVSSLVTKDNLVITQKNVGINVPIDEVKFSTDGKTVYVTTQTAFPDGQTYSVSFGDMNRDFKSSKGAIASLEIYTRENNLAVVGQSTRIFFRVKDANGVDVTPLGDTTNDYYLIQNKITWEIKNPGKATLSGNYIYFTEAGSPAVVTASYRETPTAVPITATASFTGVSEASLISIEAITVINGSVVGKDIDFSKPAIVAKGDFGRRLVLKAKGASGEDLYSNAADSRFTFETEASGNTVFFIEGDGTITPLNTGSAQVKILYDNTVISSTVVSITEERKVSALIFTKDGADMSGTITLSSVPGVDTADIVVTAYDQYQERYGFQMSDEINAYGLGTITLPVTKTLNTNGTITLSVSGGGFGSSAGKSYQIKVDCGTTCSNSFTVVVQDPPVNAPSTYKLVLTGDKDLAIPTATGGLPRLNIALYEQRGGINYDKIDNIYPTNFTIMTGQLFYEVSAPSGYKAFPSDAQHVDYIDLYTKDEHNVIKKLPTGICQVTVYRKTATGKTPVASASVLLTDSQELPVVEIIRQHTNNYTITSGMTEAAARAVFLDCAKVTWYNNSTKSYDILGTSEIEIVLVNSKIQSSARSLYIGAILCKKMVTVDSVTYTLVQQVTIGKTFTSAY